MSAAQRLQDAASVAIGAQPSVERWPQTAGVPIAEPSGAARHVRFHRDVIALGGLRSLAGRTVLDVGSGFGLGLVVLALLGAEEVHGIEFIQEAVDAVDRYLSLLDEDLRARIHNRQGDAAQIPYPDQSFDVLFSIEAISHYLDPPAFMREAARVLRPGGLLFISDGNNGVNPSVVRETHEIWRVFEEGAPGQHVGTHTLGRSYRDMRRELIAAAHPDLDGETLDLLAGHTAGFTAEAALDAAARYLRTGVAPAHPYRGGDLAISPGGMAMERMFDPRRLARDLRRHGFETKVRGYWGGAAGKPLVRVVNRLLMAASPLSMRTARGFRIVARRV